MEVQEIESPDKEVPTDDLPDNLAKSNVVPDDDLPGSLKKESSQSSEKPLSNGGTVGTSEAPSQNGLESFIQKQQDTAGQLYPETPVKIATPKPQASQEQVEDNLKNIFTSHKMWDDPAARDKLYTNLSKHGYDLNTLKESGERFVNAKNTVGELGKKANEGPQAAYEYATALSDLGKYQDAFSIYTNLIKEQHNTPEVYKGLAYTLHKLGDDKESQRALGVAKDMEKIPSIEQTNPQAEHMKMIAGTLERITPMVGQANNLIEGVHKAGQGIAEAKQILSETNKTAKTQEDVAAGVGKALLHAGTSIGGGAINYLMNTTPIGMAFVEATQGVTAEGTKKVVTPIVNQFVPKGQKEFTPEEALNLLGMPLSTIIEKNGIKNQVIKDVGFLGDIIAFAAVAHVASKPFVKGMSAEQVKQAGETATKILKGEKTSLEENRNLYQFVYENKSFRESLLNPHNDLKNASDIYKKSEKVNSLQSDIKNTQNPETKEVLIQDHEKTQADLLNTMKQQAHEDTQKTADQTHNEVLTEKQDKLKADLPNVENKDIVENTIAELEKDKIPEPDQNVLGEGGVEEPAETAPATEQASEIPIDNGKIKGEGQTDQTEVLTPEEPTPADAVTSEELPKEEKVEPIKNKQNAVSERKPKEIPVEEPSGDSKKVESGVPESKESSTVQKQKGKPRSKSSDEQTHEEVKSPLELATEKRKKAKADLDKYNKALKVIEDPEERARKLVAYHKALVEELKQWIIEKAGTLADYIRESGEEFTMGLKRAWDEANGSRPIEEAKELGYDNPDESVFGIKNESTKAQNAALGFADVDLTADQRRDIKTVLQGAAKLEGDAEKIIERTHKDKTPMNAEDEVVVLNHVIKLSNDLVAEEKKFEEAADSGDEGAVQASLLEAAVLTDRIKRANDALQISGYEQGLAFRVRQIFRKRDYSLVESIRKYQMANNGETVPHAVREKLKELTTKIADLTEQSEKLQKEHEDAVSQWAFEKIKLENERDKAQAEKPTRKRGKDLIAEGLDDLASVFGGKMNIIEDGKPEIKKAVSKIARGILDVGLEKGEDLFEKVKKYIKEKFDQELPDSYKEDVEKASEKSVPKANIDEDGKLTIPRELIKSVVEKGVDDAEDLTAKIHDIVKEQFPDKEFSHREVRDAITDYGKTIHLSQEEIDVKIRQLRQEGRDVSGLEDAIKGEGVKRTGLQRDVGNPNDPFYIKHRATLKKIKEEMKKHPQDEADIAKKWKSSLDAIKTNLNNQIADLTKRLDDLQNNRPVDEKNVAKKIEYDEEAKSLKEHRDNLQQAVEDIEGKPKMSDEQKVVNAIAATEKSLAEYERRIKNKDFAPRVIPKLPEVKGFTERLNDVRKKRDEAKAEYEKLLKEQNPKKTELQKLIDQQQKFTDDITKEKEKEKPDQAKIDELQKRKDLTKGQISSLTDEIEAQKTPEEKKLDSLQKQLDDILAGKTKEEKTKVEDSPAVKKLKDDIVRAKQVLQAAASTMPKDPRLLATERALNNYEKQIEDLARTINNRNLEYKKKTNNTYETAATKAAKARLDEGRRILKQMRDEAGIAEQRRIDLWKKRQQKAIDALEEEKKQGFPERAPKPAPKALNDAQTKILAQRQALMNQRDLAIKQRELDNRTWIEKKIAKAVAFSRDIKLSSAITVGKLLAFDIHNIVWYKPLKELLPNLMSGGERHSGRFNPKAIAAAYRTLIDKATYQDMSQARKTGKSEFQLAYGLEKPLPPELHSYFGYLHAALKVPSIRAEFLFSVEKRMQAELEKNGSWAATDPETIARVNSAALNDASAGILLGENITNDAYSALLRTLKNTQSNTTGAAALKKSFAYLAEFQLPIVKVPTNYVKEVGAHTPLGPAKAIFDIAMSKMIDKEMTPKEIDNVNNLFKTGLIGSAFLAMGYYNRDNIGGYDDRLRGKIGRGSIRLFGHEIPHWFLHFPPFELLQIGATIGHYVDKKEETGKGGVVEGVKQAAGGAISQTPFIGEPLQYGKAASREGGWSNLIASDIAGALIPPDLTKIAYATDTQDSSGVEQEGFHPMDETVYRPAKTPSEQFTTKIPIIRKDTKTPIENRLEKYQHPEEKPEKDVPENSPQGVIIKDLHDKLSEIAGEEPTKEQIIEMDKKGELKELQKKAKALVEAKKLKESQIHFLFPKDIPEAVEE